MLLVDGFIFQSLAIWCDKKSKYSDITSENLDKQYIAKDSYVLKKYRHGWKCDNNIIWINDKK